MLQYRYMKYDDDEVSATDQRFYDAYDGLEIEGVEFDEDVDDVDFENMDDE